MLGKFLGDLLLLLTAAFVGSLCVVMSRRVRTVRLQEAHRKLFRYQLILCGILLLFALDVRFGVFSAMGQAGAVLRALHYALTATVVFFCGKAAAGGWIVSKGEADHALVLGMALEDGKPSQDLKLRIETARRYLAAHPAADLILTGGNPDASGRTEAAVMRDMLVARGVPREKLLLEEKAEITLDNFVNTARMIDPARPVVLITSGYHMNRAVKTAKSAGFRHVLRLPAPSAPLSFSAGVTAEAILEINALLSAWKIGGKQA